MIKVLVIESSKTHREIAKSFLESHDIKSDQVSTLTEARQLITETAEYEAIFMSKDFDDGHCGTFCSAVRANPLTHSIPIILLTTSPQDNKEYYMALGVTEIVNRSDLNTLSDFMQGFKYQHAQAKDCGHILYVEDSISIAKLTQTMLEAKGHQIDHVTNGQQAFELFTRNDYDLVLTDVVLEGDISGLGLVNMIRDHQAGATMPTPILAISSFDDPARKVALFKAGINDYVSKPILEEELSARVSQFIINQKLFKALEISRQQMHELAMKDQLTGLYNRHYLLEHAANLMPMAERHNNRISLLVLDIDHFKQVNDNHGHDKGDEILSETAKLLLDNARQDDIVARFGGEEFIIFMNHCAIKDAAIKAEKLRKKLQALKPGGLNVTASFGVTEKVSGDDFNSLFIRADKALYEAKDGGRNCVVTA
jgi:two-component system cell cycle response regulator